MTNRDLLAMGFNNLKRRKMRTFLTVLGVIIGAASIIVMLSLGIGMNRNFMQNIERMGSLNVIDVSPEYNFENGTSTKEATLDDIAVAKFEALENVDAVMPMLNKHTRIKAGRLEGYVNIFGIDLEAMEAFDFKVSEGSLPTEFGKNEIVFGSNVSNQFHDPKSRSRYGNNQQVNLLETPLKLIPQTMEVNGQRPRGINITPVGILEVSQGEKDWSAYMDINDLEKIYEDIERRTENRDRRNEEEDKYQNVKVKVEDIEKVSEV